MINVFHEPNRLTRIVKIATCRKTLRTLQRMEKSDPAKDESGESQTREKEDPRKDPKKKLFAKKKKKKTGVVTMMTLEVYKKGKKTILELRKKIKSKRAKRFFQVGIRKPQNV